MTAGAGSAGPRGYDPALLTLMEEAAEARLEARFQVARLKWLVEQVAITRLEARTLRAALAAPRQAGASSWAG